MSSLQEELAGLSFPASKLPDKDSVSSLFAEVATMRLIATQSELTKKAGKHLLDETIIVCPIEHMPVYYGRCPDCNDWFTIKKNGNLRTHKECPSRSLWRDAPAPAGYAIMCVEDRFRLGRKQFR
jgi:hypothetical protein